MKETKAAVERYVELTRKLANELGTTSEVVTSMLTLQRLESISNQLFNQGYHRGYEAPLDEQLPDPNVELHPLPPDRRWQSPATSQRLVD